MRQNVNLAAFIPDSSGDHLRSVVQFGQFRLAQSWHELDGLVRQQSFDAVLVDPAADGLTKTGEVLHLMRKYPSAPWVAYVPLSAGSFKAVFKLSKHGLSRAVLHPAAPEKLRRTIEIVSADSLVSEFLGAIEASLGKLHPTIVQTIQELFERPHRFESGADLALHSGVAVRELYRDFCWATLGTPWKLVTIAKLLRGYSCLRHSSASIQFVAVRLGYSDKRTFAAHTRAVFGCSPTQLRACSKIAEVVMQSLDWFYKPSPRTQVRYDESVQRALFNKSQLGQSQTGMARVGEGRDGMSFQHDDTRAITLGE